MPKPILFMASPWRAAKGRTGPRVGPRFDRRGTPLGTRREGFSCALSRPFSELAAVGLDEAEDRGVVPAGPVARRRSDPVHAHQVGTGVAAGAARIGVVVEARA